MTKSLSASQTLAQRYLPLPKAIIVQRPNGRVLIEMLVIFLGRPASYEPDDQNYYGDHQKRMNEPAGNMEGKT